MVSPGAGLLFYSPVILFAFLGAARAFGAGLPTAPLSDTRSPNPEHQIPNTAGPELGSECLGLRPSSRLLCRYLTVAILASFLAMGRWWCWYGGVCWGYRMIVDFMPFLCFFLPFAFPEGAYRGWLKYAFLVLLALSVAVQLLGILTFDHSWHMAFDRGKEDQSWLWSLRDCQIVAYLRRNVWYVGPYRVDL
jgi:hypothetical protein